MSETKHIYSNDGAFCALKSDGTVQAWGHIDYGATVPADISNVKDIFCSSKSFTALTRNNSLITWGNDNDGSGNIIQNANLVKRLQSKRLYGNNVISTVKNNNLDMTNNYKFNNGNYERPITQVLSKNDYNFTKSFSETILDKINNITVKNGEIIDDDLPTMVIETEKKRHELIDTIFTNIADVSFNISTKKIGMELKLSKSKTKILHSSQTMNLTSSGNDLTSEHSVYSNISDLSDNVTVNMENNVSFKVTRTTVKSAVGKYNIEVLSGKMVVYGRHYGTIQSLPYSPDNWINTTTTGMQSGYNPVNYTGYPVFYNNNMYFYGRRQSSTNYSEMWKLNLTTNTWSKLTTTGTIASTQGHSMILYNDCFYIFGGKDASNWTNNTYKFDLSTNIFSQITTSGTAPGIRYQHAVCLNGTDMIISGGHNQTTHLKSTFKLDLTTNAWSEISTTNSDVANRNGHTIFMYNSKLYMIGGNSPDSDGNGGYIRDNLYSLNLTTNAWSQITTTGSFTGSYYPSINLVDNDVYILGGWTPTVTSGLNKFYKLDLTTNTFTEPAITGKPSADWAMLSVYNNYKIYYQGGTGGNNKLYTLNFAGGISSTTTLGPYEDDDEIYINKDKFFFGGFGCSELNKASSDDSKLYLCVVTASQGIGVLFQDGSVKCIGRDYYNTSGKNVDSNVTKLVASTHHFIALKSDGSCVIWGSSGTSDMIDKKFRIQYRDTVTSSNISIKFDYTKLLESDCIDIFSINDTGSDGTVFIKKSDGSIVILGYGHQGSSPGYYINSDIIPPGTKYNGGTGKVKAEFYGSKFLGLSEIQYTSTDMSYWKGASINYKGNIVTWGGRGDVGTYYTHGNYGENVTHWEYGIAGERRSTITNELQNKEQNLTYNTLRPTSKIILATMYCVAIFNNGSIGLWGSGHHAWGYNTDNTINTSSDLTINVWNEIQKRVFVDGLDSYDNCALLDASGGVIIFGNGCGSAFYNGAPNHLGNDISANVIKMLSNNYGGFAFLRSDNVAVIWREESYTESISIPDKFSSTMTKKGDGSVQERLLFPNIVDIFNAGYCDFFLKTNTGEGFLINCQKGTGGYIRDVGITVGGSISAIKRVYTNGNATCILKEDNTLVQFYGSKESYMKFGHTQYDHHYQLAMIGADYNHFDWGINGIWNGGNGKGGCVFNGDGSEQVLKNVKQIIPISCNTSGIPTGQSSVGLGGFIAIIDNGDDTQSLVMWGNTTFSHKYIDRTSGGTTRTYNVGGVISYPVVKSNFTNKVFSNQIISIRNSTEAARNKTIFNQYVGMYENNLKYGANCEIIKLTVENDKFVFNNDTSAFTFEMGKTYIFDTSDSSNINYRLKVCGTLNTNDTKTSVQFLTPGEKNSFIRYIKMTKHTYIYCDINGISMGSHYNSATDAAELTALSTVYGDNTEKNLISTYTSIPDTNIIQDASFNSITLDTDDKIKAVMEALFTVQPENHFITKKDIFGYTKSTLGIASPLLYANKMKIINSTSVNRGISISGETVWSGAVDLGNVSYDECIYINMRDLNDNVSLCLGGSEYGYSTDFSSVTESLVKPGVEFILKRTTAHDASARYTIEFISTFNTVYTNASNFNASNNTGYFEENDLIDVFGTEITFTENGLITKGSAKKYTVITTTVDGNNKFVFNGDSTTIPVLEYDKNYKFDVSDSSNTDYILKFSKTNATDEYNTKNYGTPGTAGAYVTFTPGAFSEVYVFCSTNGLNMGSLYNPMSLNNGISKTNLENIEADTIDNNITLPTGFYGGLTGVDNLAKEGQKRRRRHQFLRTIFASNQDNSTLETSKTNLGFDSSYKKNTYKVFNPKTLGGNVTINMNSDNELDNTTGFYSPLEDGDHALITNTDGDVTLKVTRTSSDSAGNGIYYVENNDSTGELFITETNSLTYKNSSSPAGPFKDGDTATINFMELVFGGIGDGSSTNSSEKPGPTTHTPQFENFSMIPIFGTPNRNGFFGIDNDGDLYSWGTENTGDLVPGDPDTDNTRKEYNRISDLSFCVISNHGSSYELLYVTTGEGRPKTHRLVNSNSSNYRINSVTRSRTDGWNYWYNGDVSSNDFTDLSGIVGIYPNRSKNRWDQTGLCAVLLRDNGTIAFWCKVSPPYMHTDTTNDFAQQTTNLNNDYNKKTFYGPAAECLFNENHSNFSKIVKISITYGSFLFLREDGKIALVRCNKTNGVDHTLYWQGPSNTDNIDTCSLNNTLTDDGTDGNPMKIFGNVVDIGSRGNTVNDGALWFLNDKGQAFMFVQASSNRDYGLHQSLSYDMTSQYFKKTVKILTWQNNHLQIFEDGTTAIPYKAYYGENNQQLDKANPRQIRNTGGMSLPANRDVFDGTVAMTEGNHKLYYANSKSPRIKKYYGPLLLLQDNTVSPGRTLNGHHANWNHSTYGIYGTGNGYPANTEPYGDLSNVKSLHWGQVGYSWAALLHDNTVLTWGYTGTNYFSNSYDVSNQLINVKKIVTSNFAAAALKNDGSVVVWGKTDSGGEFDVNTAGTTSTMSDNTLDSGVLDVFATEEGFTAVKSDGIIIWGKYKDNYDDTDDLTWTTDTDYIMRADSLNSIQQNNAHSSNRNDMNHIVHFPKYSTSTEQDTIASDLLTAGVSQTDVDTMLSYPKYLTKLDYFYIPTTCFSSGDKDVIRGLIIDLIFSMNKKKDKFDHDVVKLSLDTKIKKDNVTVFKPNLGIIDLLNYKYHYKSFYVHLKENDTINFKSFDDLIFRITKGASDYTITKLSGSVDLSLNVLGPYSEGSSVTVNGKKIKFVLGVADGDEIPEQIYNCVETNWSSAAYLDKSIGRVITWGKQETGGYSHDDFHNTGRDVVTSYNSAGSTLSYGVVSIVSSSQAFAALKDNGSVIVWGKNSYGGDLLNSTYAGSGLADLLTSNVSSIHGSYYGFGALKSNGDFYCWGSTTYFGTSGRKTYPSNQFPVKNVEKVFPALYGFVLVKTDGSLSGIGSSVLGHDPTFLSNSSTYEINDFTLNQFTSDDSLQNVKNIYTSRDSHVAILNDVCGNKIKLFGNNSNYIVKGKIFSNEFKTRKWKNVVVGNNNNFAAIDVSGGVIAWGHNNIVNGTLGNPTSGQWMDISGDVSANVVRVVANKWAWMCLRNDNVLVSIDGGDRGTGYKCYDFENTDNSYKKPPSEYIISKYKLRNIKDIFASQYGFGAIDISDNIVCWGYSTSKYVNEVPHGYTDKIHGGDLSGNDISKNRPVALFSNGFNWCCLKEDDTIVTWDRYNGNDHDHGSNHMSTSYGVNSTRWGGNGTAVDGNAGGVRNDDGNIKITGNVKNIIPFNTYDSNYRGYIAIQEDSSSNQFCVGWGGSSGERETSSTPSTTQRSFRHIVDYLTSHGVYQIGVKNNGLVVDDRWPWLRSNIANLHEYDEGTQTLTGDDTGFGKPITLVEIYDVGNIEADASNSGVDISAIQQLKENKLNTDVDETSESMPTENSVVSGTLKTDGKTPREIRKQRKNILKLAFANNPTRTKFKIDSGTLGFSSTTTKRKKSSYVVYKVSFGKVTIDLKEDKTLNDNTGFFVPLEAGNEATIKNNIGDFKITQSEENFEDGSDKFFVEGVGGTVSRIVNYDSTTYDDKSSPQGPFKEGDSATINGVHIDFGSISEGTGNYSFGDPYIKPIFGGISKLPDEKAYYRLFEGKDLFINCYVNKISPEKQEYMEKWFYNKTGYDSKLFGFVTSGFFYNEIFISSENKTMFLDFEKAIIDMDSEDIDYFKIENNYEREKDNKYLLNAKCNKYSISWPHETYNNIKFIVKIYENPQIDNAISIEVESNVSNCKGLLVRNYKPNLMKIKDVKTLKCKKLNRRLKRAKNKYTTKKIKKKNEVWVKM